MLIPYFFNPGMYKDNSLIQYKLKKQKRKVSSQILLKLEY